MNGIEYAVEAKRLRQARRTTDPRFTSYRPSPSNGASEYVCKGCGKTSQNGGAFGFHVRACTALDVHDVAKLSEAPAVPALFAHGKTSALGSVEHCAVCGRKVSSDPTKVWWVGTTGGCDPVPLEADADSGAFPVGSECAKAFPAGYLAKEDGQ